MKQLSRQYSSSDSSRTPRLLMAQQAAQKDSAKKNESAVPADVASAKGHVPHLDRRRARGAAARGDRLPDGGQESADERARDLRRRLSPTRPKTKTGDKAKLPPDVKGFTGVKPPPQILPEAAARSNRSPRRRRD